MNAEQLQAATRSSRMLVGLVDGLGRYPLLVLVVALALVAASIVLSSTQLAFHTQRSDLISPDKQYQQRWRQYLAEFGDDDDMVVVVKGVDRERMKLALDGLAATIRQRPECFDRLFYRVDLRGLQNRALLYLPAEQIQEIQDNLRSMNVLLEIGPVAWRSLTLASLLGEANNRLERRQPGQPLSAADEQFFTQLVAILNSASASLDDPARYRNPWIGLLQPPADKKDLLAEPQYFFSDPEEQAGGETLAFLLVRPVKDKDSFTPARSSVDALRALVAPLRGQYADLQFGVTGLPVLETDEMVASQNDSNLASWLALAGVALLYLVVYRSWRYPLLTVVTLLVGIAWSLGWLTLTVGHLNILSATFAVMLIGMGDYGVLWVTRYEQERAAGFDLRAALRRTAAGVGPSILTAALTTSLAFFAAMLADFKAVAELGWIAGSGVLLCALSCFTVLPALLVLFEGRRVWQGPRAESTTLHLPSTRQAWLPFLAGRPRWVLGVSMALIAFFGFFACRASYDHNLLHLQANNLESVQWELLLIERTAGASWHALSTADSAAEALALKARYEKEPAVSRVVEVASLVPPQQEEKLPRLADIRHRLRRLPERDAVIPHAQPNVRELQDQLAALNDRLDADIALNEGRFIELAIGVQRLHASLAGAPSEARAAAGLQDYEQRLAGDLAEDLHRLKDVSTAAPIVLADLPAELRERYVGASGKYLVRAFARDCLWDFGPLKAFCGKVQAIDPEATGKPFATLEGLRAMKNGFLWAGLYALIAIVTVLLVDFRNFQHTLLALVPLAMGLVVALGIMTLCGVPLNPANMIALPLILGVGVDNAVHVLHDYLARKPRTPYTLSHSTGRGIAVTALTTILGFGALMISQHRGLVSLGFMLTLGVACCMLSALVFLPAWLRMQSTPVPEAKPVSLHASSEHRAAA